jgi:hypothetical protein
MVSTEQEDRRDPEQVQTLQSWKKSVVPARSKTMPDSLGVQPVASSLYQLSYPGFFQLVFDISVK